MHLNRISIVNFKSFAQLELEFDSKINCFVGNNGQGKTNLLDAIYYLSMCKSALNPLDSQVVKHGETFFVLQGEYSRNDSETQIYCGYKQSEGKVFKRNGKSYERLADHIGYIPVVLISPADSSLIGESGDERRKYMNSVISQFDKLYLNEVVRYNQVLSQRNKLLKNQSSPIYSPDILEAIDEQLVLYANSIHEKRQKFIEELIPIFQEYYSLVSGMNEEVSLKYKSQLNDNDFSELLKQKLGKDRALEYTSTGIHRDDMTLQIDGYPIKREGSQGQQKTYLIALKLAQFDFLSKISEVEPILLLDDIFDKLDTGRLERLVNMVAHDGFGQIFITDTNKNHLDNVLEKVNTGYKLFRMENSKAELLTSK